MGKSVSKYRAVPGYAAYGIFLMHMYAHAYLSSLTGQNTGGILDGTVTYHGLINGTGEANLKISSRRIELPEPFFNLDAIEFAEARIKVVLGNRRIEVPHVKLKGRGTCSEPFQGRCG
ncbi:MAG: hypothetical protein B5M55_05400 [Desulfococcus sp. 4484_242]|nr:MAG: hypothetical protein B5M55_05400 [Desulfococcus sp. 4484_242]